MPFYNSLKGKIPLYCEIWGHFPHRIAEWSIKKNFNISFVVTELLDSFESQPDRWKKGKLDFFFCSCLSTFPFPGFTQIVLLELTEDAWKNWPFEGGKVHSASCMHTTYKFMGINPAYLVPLCKLQILILMIGYT